VALDEAPAEHRRHPLVVVVEEPVLHERGQLVDHRTRPERLERVRLARYEPALASDADVEALVRRWIGGALERARATVVLVGPRAAERERAARIGLTLGARVHEVGEGGLPNMLARPGELRPPDIAVHELRRPARALVEAQYGQERERQSIVGPVGKAHAADRGRAREALGRLLGARLDLDPAPEERE